MRDFYNIKPIDDGPIYIPSSMLLNYITQHKSTRDTICRMKYQVEATCVDGTVYGGHG